MRKYPKFLKTMPSFFGLGPMDLLFLGLGLFVSLIFDLSPMWALLVSGVLMISSKIIRTYCDVVGFLLPYTKRIEIRGDWRDTTF